MSTRHLSILLALLMLGGAGFAVVSLVVGPRRVEEQTVDLFKAQQELLAEQGAARISQSLSELEIRLASAVAQPGTELHHAETRWQWRRALDRLGHTGDAKAGITLLVQTTGGEVLAVDPRASEALRRSLLEQATAPSKDSWTWMVSEGCETCVSDQDRVLVATVLQDDLLLAASVDVDILAHRLLDPVTRGRSTRVRIATDNGRLLYDSAPQSDQEETEWVQGRAPIADTDWRVEVAAPRSAIAPEVRERASAQLIGAYAMLSLLLVGLILLGLIERRKHVRHLEQVRALAHQDKLATLGMLAASAAHEIRNAIAAAQMQLAVASDRADDELRDRIEAASTAISRLAKLAQNLAGYAGRDNEKSGRLDLCDAVREALDVISPKVDQKTELKVELEPDTDIIGSQSAIVQVIVNLVLNAYDAVQDQESATIEVSVSRRGDSAWLSVRDDGPGIEDGLLERIFEPFFSTKGSDSEQGTGIGLWLTSQIVRQHDGRVEAENDPEGGARFNVVLPLASDEESRLPAETQPDDSSEQLSA